MTPSVSAFLHRFWLQGLFLLVILSRLPFLGTGYGSDGDAWRVAETADHLARTGEYHVSRFPGYPLNELVFVPLVGTGGSFLTNGATLLAFLVLLFIWHRLVRERTNHPRLLVAALAFTPMVWANSAGTMDYVWSLLFLILAVHALLSRRIVLAGVCLGAATGFRPVNAVAAVPLLLLLHLEDKSPRDAAGFILSASLTAILAFTPVWLTYGVSGWIDGTRFQAGLTHLTVIQRALYWAYRSVYSVGLPAFLVAAYILIKRRRNVAALFSSRSSFLIAAVGIVGAFAVLFFAYPLEREYLLPALPFLFIILDAVALRREFLLFTLCLAMYAFVNIDVIEHRFGAGSIGLDVREGVVVEELHKRTSYLDERERIAQTAFVHSSIIMTGKGPAFWFRNPHVEEDTVWKNFDTKDVVVHQRSNPNVLFVDILLGPEIADMQRRGFDVYCVEPMTDYIAYVAGIDLQRAGVKILR
jgi:hypothetical protein